MINNFTKSENFLKDALKVIPGGTQTFSKSYTQYPFGVSPYYISHAKGSKIWDVDGNEFTDFVSALLAVNLGYNDTDVNNAVIEQVNKGVLFSLPDVIEIETAKKIVDMVPSAEMVRFGKNGSDATAGAIRLSRAYTKRDRVIVCGYHGWQDWYIGSTTRNAGVPNATSSLTHKFNYNDIESLKEIFRRHPDEIAAVIMEPINAILPADNFLEEVRDTCHENGALLVFDEIITCFRFSNGGVQELYSVIPDLTALGKGLANGYPLSAIVGKAEIMQLMEEVFFSFTLGGETVSLAAANAVLDKLKAEPVTKSINENGKNLVDGLMHIIKTSGAGKFVSVSGHPAWSFLNFTDVDNYSMWEIKTLWMQECLQRGVICLGTHNINYSHTHEDIKKLLSVYDEVFSIISEAIKNNNLSSMLRCEALQPLFKIR